MTTPHGQKVKAGMRLNKLMVEVGNETTETELAGLDGKGNARQITKMEALIRTIWKLALGYTEVVEKRNKGGKLVRETVKHDPDRSCMMLIYDRLEGKVGSTDKTHKPPTTVAKKTRDAARQRANAMAEEGGSAD